LKGRLLHFFPLNERGLFISYPLRRKLLHSLPLMREASSFRPLDEWGFFIPSPSRGRLLHSFPLEGEAFSFSSFVGEASSFLPL
jgi:hypothetical protein